MTKKITIILGLILIAGASVGLIWASGGFKKDRNGADPNNQPPITNGNEQTISSFEDCIAKGLPVMESYPRQCRAVGKTFVEDIGNELEKIGLIRIENPRPNQVVTSPLEISGEARGNWYFEADFPVKLLNEKGEVIAQGIATAQSDWMTTEFVRFTARLEFSAEAGKKGTLVLEKDNPSGLPENSDELRIPVKFGAAAETMTVKVFLLNDKLDPEVSCEKVFPVERTVAKTEGVARAAIEELLGGLEGTESADGYSTSINPGVAIQSLTIENGVARVDFSGQLEFQVGGSCRVTAIRAQITETLKQFPTVKDVVISVDGRVEDALQP